MTRRRSGYSLIELLAVMSAASLVLLALTVWLVMLVRGSQAGQDHLLWTITQDRLASQFRSDAHAALAVLDAGGALVCFQVGSDRTIVYRQQDRRLLREELADGQRIRQEAYALPKSWSVSIDERQWHGTPLAVLTIAAHVDAPDAAPTARLQVEAQLGTFQRLERSAATEETP